MPTYVYKYTYEYFSYIEEEDEEEEDRINQKYVDLNNDNTSEDGFDESGNEIEGDEEEEETADGDLLDLEDIGSAMRKQKLIEKQNKAIADSEEDRNGGREMVTKLQRRALTKEGYRIIGTCSYTKEILMYISICWIHMQTFTCTHVCAKIYLFWDSLCL